MRPRLLNPCAACFEISIHAPRVGCDVVGYVKILPIQNFNPRTPGGVRPAIFQNSGETILFQSTHPGWGATEDKKQKQIRRWNFNPRTPGGVRPAWAQWSSARSHFNPRTPGGVRRAFSSVGSWFSEISIHAPRVGCDIRPYGLARPSIHFNPRTPGGVRPIYDLCVSLYQLEFQSTHPGWGATRGTLAISKAGLIFQSTPPGWGATNQI